jgi:hypothetical protein
MELPFKFPAGSNARHCIITEHSGRSHSLPSVLRLVAIRAGEDCSVCAGATAPLAAAAAAAAAAAVV